MLIKVYFSSCFGCQQSVINNTQNIYITGDLSGNNAVINCTEGDEYILFRSNNRESQYVSINGCNNLLNDSVFRQH